MKDLEFVNDEDLFLKVLSLKEKVSTLKDIYTFEHVANAKHWKEVTASGTPEFIAQVKPIADKINYEDLATIIYTSGTTGTPKESNWRPTATEGQFSFGTSCTVSVT